METKLDQAIVIKFIKDCKDYDFLEKLKKEIDGRLVDLSDDSQMDIETRIYRLIPLAHEIRGCIPHGDEGSPEELLTDFMDEYMYVIREKTFLYDNILSNLHEEFNGDGIELRNGEIMSQEQYDEIVDFIYNEVKMGWKGFDWDW